MTKNRYNFDSFTLAGYCHTVGILKKFDNLREKRSVPLLNSQVLHVLKIIVAHQLKITGLEA